MKDTRLERLQLSLIVEPGDPRLPELLEHHELTKVLAAATGKDGLRVPASWRHRARTTPEAADVLASAHSLGMRWVTRNDEQWPMQLDDLDHAEPIGGATGAPLGLWVRGPGNLAELSQFSASIVGARSCTTYGADTARDIAANLSASNITVISGAAYGIDAFAHRGALATGRPTVAVLAGGADIAYPRAHAGLLEQIVANGCLVSEQAPGSRPLRPRFLARNRIIAGLATGTIIVEAAARSGSLNTLNWADQLGRVSLAVPGPVNSASSAGTHAAIRSGQALLVGGSEHVREELGGLGAEQAHEAIGSVTIYDQWSPGLRHVYDALTWEPATRSEIARLAHISPARTSEHLASLTAAGFAEHIGGKWRLLRRADLR